MQGHFKLQTANKIKKLVVSNTVFILYDSKGPLKSLIWCSIYSVEHLNMTFKKAKLHIIYMRNKMILVEEQLFNKSIQCFHTIVLGLNFRFFFDPMGSGFHI